MNPGGTISHYRILEKLGEGGMGVVYKAEDTRLRRIVALKFLPPHAAAHRDQFLREAQAAAALNHPNICTIFEVDEQLGFIAMEFLCGPNLKDKIADRPLPLEEALELAVQSCTGLQSAHENGVIHRDIKPANLMLSALGQLKIMDFGLAQLGDRTRLTKTGSSMGTPAYLLALPVDENTLQANGDPAVVAERIHYQQPSCYGAFDVSANGQTLVYVSGQAFSQLRWFDRKGSQQEILGPPQPMTTISLSPDGKHLAFSMPDRGGGNRDLWILGAGSNAPPQRLTVDPNNDWIPIWSPDRKQIMFYSDRNGGTGNVFVTSPGSSRAEPMFDQDRNTAPRGWQNDHVLYHIIGNGIWMRSTTGGGKPVLLLKEEFGHDDATISPDGRFLSYTSTRSGRAEIYLRPLDGSLDARQVSLQGGKYATWRRAGGELFYIAEDSSLMSVEIGRGPEPGAPRKLFQTCLPPSNDARHEMPYDMTADGQRFLFQCQADNDSETRIHVIHNWQRMLASRTQ